MEVKRGFGYQGVMMHDENEDKLQCHICGKWFKHIGRHSVMTHKMSAAEYKDEFGFTGRTALCAKSVSAKNREVGLKNYSRFNVLRNKWTKSHRPKKPRKGHFAYSSMQVRNRLGLCDLQVRSRYDIVKAIVNHDPSIDEMVKYDAKLYGYIRRHYGTLNKYKTTIGTKTTESIPIPVTECIAALRKLAKIKKRLPYTTDFIKGVSPHFTTILKHFGSWSNALRTAGLK